MKTALVTGSAGFIGRHMVTHLVEHGWWVDTCDLVDGIDCRQVFAESDDVYDLVVHCAAVVGGRAMIDGDPMALAVNLAIDSDMFRWATRTRQHRIVYFSSSAAYPTRLQQRPSYRLAEWHITPDTIDSPDQTYGWAKVTGEMLARQAQAEGVQVHVFRPFSGYGEDQSTDYPFPSFARRALRREDPFDIWGNGRSTRDWIHVDDIIGAVQAAIDTDAYGPVNLCTGIATTFDHLAELFTRNAGYTPTIRHLDDKPQGVPHRVGQPHHLRSFYQPKVALQEGIARTLKAAAVTA